jgi:hypothetical protein
MLLPDRLRRAWSRFPAGAVARGRPFSHSSRTAWQHHFYDTFNIVGVGANDVIGVDVTGSPDRVVAYDGSQVVVK